MSSIEYFKEQFDHLQNKGKSNGAAVNGTHGLAAIRQNAFQAFSKLGIPTVRNEEWKYTRIGSLFNKDLKIPVQPQVTLTASEVDGVRLPGHEKANQLVFVNGIYSPSLSTLHTQELVVLPLEEASGNEYRELVAKHLGHSAGYLKDGINALNTAFVHGGVFIHVKKGKITELPVYIYNITDARTASILSQPRSLIHVDENAQIQLVETYATIGSTESFTNQVMEIVIEKDARVEYYKIQNDAAHASQVSTTHFHQVGKSYVHAVTVSLNGAIVRNNTNVVMEAEHTEAHLYGLYFHKGKSHIDNHTIVDNVKPHCYSNELYKGILDEQATGVFNGKIFVRPQAQKINAFQSNKNILLSGTASVNTKPQLEIFADDVKCSHGCTVGQLNEEGLFYLRSRGVREKTARALLVHAFAVDILDEIRPEAVRHYIEKLVSERLEFDKI
jgi:Fe-S cluster assembly protein SufD